MRPFLLLAVLSALLFAVGCGGDPSTPSAEAESVAPAVTGSQGTSARAAELILTVDDLPDGWQREPDGDAGAVDLCGVDGSGFFGIPTRDEAEATFATTAAVPSFLAVGVATFGPGGAEESFTEAKKALSRCDTFVSDEIEASLEKVAFPPYGDESTAHIARTEVDGVPVAFYVIAVRVSSAVAHVTTVSFVDGRGHAEAMTGLVVEKMLLNGPDSEGEVPGETA